jgi:peptide deformylase
MLRQRRSSGIEPMAVLPIVMLGDPGDEVLRRPAQRVREFGPALHALLDDMVATLRDAPGVGLAAPQVGIAQRIAVIEYPADDEDPESPLQLFEIINPEIIKIKGAEEGQEGCLSMPGLAADVVRGTHVVVRAQDRHGNEVRIKAYDWLARIFQHEIDHVLGVLMTDRADQVYRMQRAESGEWESVPIENTLRRPVTLPNA